MKLLPLRVPLPMLLVMAALVGHSRPIALAQDSRLPVVATFSILGDFVQNVGGDRIQLTTLVGSDGDTHTYEPVPGDARALATAAVIVENGLEFETWLNRLYATSGSSARRVVVSEGIGPLTLDVGGHTEPDPHIWQDVTQAARMVMAVRDALAQADPTNADVYAANAGAYLARLQNLDAWVIEQVATVPPERRKLVTSHDSLGYFARRYGFDIVGSTMVAFSTEAEPSAAHLAQLARDVRAAGVPAIFPENMLGPRLVQRIAAEARVGVAPPLYSDALGAPGTAGATYIGMMQYNVATIGAALRGWS